MIGTVKRLVPDLGFGFVADDEGVLYFFHRTAMAEGFPFAGLRAGQRVTFEIATPGAKGPRAGFVRPYESAALLPPRPAA